MSDKNLVEYMSVYRDGDLWVVAETGMPEHAVKIGTGDSLREAYDSLETTAIQSVGRDSGLSDALEWAHSAGWISHPDELEELDDAELFESEGDDGRVCLAGF